MQDSDKKEWFENERFWLEYGPIMFDSQHWAEAKGIAQACMEIADLKPGDSILDACCGPGRISVELALLGLKVTGTDITQPFLDAANETAQDEGVQIEFLNRDMRCFGGEGDKKFNAAVNIYNSFGYCDSIQDDMKILRNIYQSLLPGGTFILECISRETAVRYFTEGEWFNRAGVTVLTQFSVVGAWEGLRSRWILIGQDGKRTDHEFVQRLYSAAELRDSLKQIGYSSVEVYGGFGLTPYDQNAKTMVLVCRKQ